MKCHYGELVSVSSIHPEPDTSSSLLQNSFIKLHFRSFVPSKPGSPTWPPHLKVSNQIMSRHLVTLILMPAAYSSYATSSSPFMDHPNKIGEKCNLKSPCYV